MNWSLTRPALLLIAVGQLLASCSKESDKVAPQPQQPLSQNSTAYDYIGQQHNKGLDYILANAPAQFSRDQVKDMTVEFGGTQGYDKAAMQATLQDKNVVTVIYSSSPDRELRNYYTANGMTQELAYFDQISNALSQTKTADDAAKQLDQVGQSVENDQKLSDDSQVALLQAISVAKYSSAYWYDQAAQGDKSPWVTKFKAPITGANAKPLWAIALADACGALMGASGGPLGAIGGAIGASILYCLP